MAPALRISSPPPPARRGPPPLPSPLPPSPPPSLPPLPPVPPRRRSTTPAPPSSEGPPRRFLLKLSPPPRRSSMAPPPPSASQPALVPRTHITPLTKSASLQLLRRADHFNFALSAAHARALGGQSRALARLDAGLSASGRGVEPLPRVGLGEVAAEAAEASAFASPSSAFTSACAFTSPSTCPSAAVGATPPRSIRRVCGEAGEAELRCCGARVTMAEKRAGSPCHVGEGEARSEGEAEGERRMGELGEREEEAEARGVEGNGRRWEEGKGRRWDGEEGGGEAVEVGREADKGGGSAWAEAPLSPALFLRADADEAELSRPPPSCSPPLPSLSPLPPPPAPPPAAATPRAVRWDRPGEIDAELATLTPPPPPPHAFHPISSCDHPSAYRSLSRSSTRGSPFELGSAASESLVSAVGAALEDEAEREREEHSIFLHPSRRTGSGKGEGFHPHGSMASRHAPPAASHKKRPANTNVAQDIALLRTNRWLHAVPPDDLVRLWMRGQLVHFRRYAHIMREGTKGECFFVIIHGTVQIYTSSNGVEGVYEQGMSFGEAGLVLDAHLRQKSAVALESCTVLSLSADDVAAVGVDLSELREHVIIDYLSRVRFFKDLSVEARRSLARIAHMKVFKAGVMLFEEGDEGEEMYIVVEGCVQMIRRLPGIAEPRVVGEVTTHSETPWFGEMALCHRKPRGASARVAESTKLLSFHRADFRLFTEAVPTFLNMVLVNATAWQKINEQLGEIEQSRVAMSAARTLAGVSGKWGFVFQGVASKEQPEEVSPLARFRMMKDAALAMSKSEVITDEVAKKRQANVQGRQEAMLQQIREASASQNPHPLKQWQDKLGALARPPEVGQRPALLKIPTGVTVGLGSGSDHVVRPTKHRVLTPPKDPAMWNSMSLFGPPS